MNEITMVRLYLAKGSMQDVSVFGVIEYFGEDKR